MDTDTTLGITSTSSVVSASQLVAYPNATLSTPYVQTSGLINLSDLDLSTTRVIYFGSLSVIHQQVLVITITELIGEHKRHSQF